MTTLKKLNDNAQWLNADCIETMQYMKEHNIQVDLTVTSPPYDNLRTYGNKTDWSFDKFKEITKLLYDITSDGGIVVWVVGDATINGSETGSSFKQALYFMECGFKLHDTMIYEKNSSSFPARRDSKRYTQIFEYMFIFVKGKIKTGHLICDKKNIWAGVTNWGCNTQYDVNGNKVVRNDIKPVPEFSPRTNIWKYSVGFNVNIGKHSAVFPIKLAEDHILSWSNEGDIVFDPFLGSGTTMFAAIKNNRRFIGCEINEDYVKSYEDNYKQYLKRWQNDINRKNKEAVSEKEENN